MEIHKKKSGYGQSAVTVSRLVSLTPHRPVLGQAFRPKSLWFSAAQRVVAAETEEKIILSIVPLLNITHS